MTQNESAESDNFLLGYNLSDKMLPLTMEQHSEIRAELFEQLVASILGVRTASERLHGAELALLIAEQTRDRASHDLKAADNKAIDDAIERRISDQTFSELVI